MLAAQRRNWHALGSILQQRKRLGQVRLPHKPDVAAPMCMYVCLCVHVRLHMCVYAYIRTCENVCVFVLGKTSGIPLHVCVLGCVCGPEGHVCMHVSAGIQTYVHAQMGGWVGNTICTRSVRMYVNICGHS